MTIKLFNHQKKNISTSELTSNITEKFHDDCKYLNYEIPTHEPKATENIELMVNMIHELLKINLHMKIKNTFILKLKILEIMENFQIKILMI